MSEQMSIRRISAYTWALILALSGGALFLVALGGSPGGVSAPVLANASKRDVITSTDQVSASEAVLQRNGYGTGITPINETE